MISTFHEKINESSLNILPYFAFIRTPFDRRYWLLFLCPKETSVYCGLNLLGYIKLFKSCKSSKKFEICPVPSTSQFQKRQVERFKAFKVLLEQTFIIFPLSVHKALAFVLLFQL